MISATGEKKYRGFTLVELCLAGSILAMIASLSWPVLRNFSHAINDRTQANHWQQKFSNAREQAILSGHVQCVSPRAEGAVRMSAPSAAFFSDGSAQYFTMEWAPRNNRTISLTVHESGTIETHEK